MSNMLSRRVFLKAAGVSAAALGSAALFGGCGSNSSNIQVKVGDRINNWNNLAVQLVSVFRLADAPDAENQDYVAVMIAAANRSGNRSFAIGAQNILDIDAAYPLETPEQIEANTAPYFHALAASTTDFAFSCDGQPVEGGAYATLYDDATETRSNTAALPPQSVGSIELICQLPDDWKELTITYTPLFASGKTMTFTLSVSDLAKPE